MEQEIEQKISEYYQNNAKKLRTMINQIFHRHYGGINDKDIDEFYGIGTDVLIEIWKKHKNGNETFDFSKGDFDGYVYNAIRMAIIDEFKRQNRDKRKTKVFLMDENGNKVLDEKTGKPIKVPVPDIRLDAPLKDGEDATLKDMIPSDFDVNDYLIKECEYSETIEEYLNSLSEMPKKAAILIMNGYNKEEIINMMQITLKQYKDCMSAIKSYDSKRVLYSKNSIDVEEKEMDTMIMEHDMAEDYKNTSYSIYSISKQLRKKKIRDDHILQRHSGQWKNFAKSELVADILRGKSLTQIIICEEIKNGLRMQWLIDGKQRCTTLDSYLYDEFAISKNVKNYNIKYQTPKIDENGNEILNEDGFPMVEWKVFDIRGKKFSQLPEELREVFKDRQIPVLYEMNCSKKDIAENIARFNRSRPMNKAQNGWLELEEGFAELVENIAKMPFFQPEFAGSSYTKTTNTSGIIRRIIVESIMVSDFIDDFGDFNQMCNFLSEEASDSNFTEFYSLVERITEICKTDKSATLFNTKDSFLWFGLFSRFSNLNLNDKEFENFMDNFHNLRVEKINGKSYDDILNESKSTKEKSIIKKKMNHLELLMNNYFSINKSECEGSEIETDEVFISRNVNVDINELHNDMEFYGESLEDLTNNTIRDGSKLLDKQNRLSLLAMVVYSYKQDVDLEEWLTDFAQKNNTYLADQEKNFLYMKDDFEKFIENQEKKEKKTA